MSPSNGHANNCAAQRNIALPAAALSDTNSEGFQRLGTDEVRGYTAELEIPFPLEVIEWRVTNTNQQKTRGQVIPYADQRAYTDRLNALFTPAGWTRKYA